MGVTNNSTELLLVGSVELGEGPVEEVPCGRRKLGVLWSSPSGRQSLDPSGLTKAQDVIDIEVVGHLIQEEVGGVSYFTSRNEGQNQQPSDPTVTSIQRGSKSQPLVL